MPLMETFVVWPRGSVGKLLPSFFTGFGLFTWTGESNVFVSWGNVSLLVRCLSFFFGGFFILFFSVRLNLSFISIIKFFSDFR